MANATTPLLSTVIIWLLSPLRCLQDTWNKSGLDAELTLYMISSSSWHPQRMKSRWQSSPQQTLTGWVCSSRLKRADRLPWKTAEYEEGHWEKKSYWHSDPAIMHHHHPTGSFIDHGLQTPQHSTPYLILNSNIMMTSQLIPAQLRGGTPKTNQFESTYLYLKKKTVTVKQEWIGSRTDSLILKQEWIEWNHALSYTGGFL